MLAMLQSMSSWPPLDHWSTCRAVGNLTTWCDIRMLLGRPYDLSFFLNATTKNT